LKAMIIKSFLPAACLLASIVSQVQAAYVPGEMGSLPVLLSHAKVQESLKLTPAQIRSLSGIRTSYEKSAAATSAAAKAPGADRKKAFNELEALRRSANTQALRVLDRTQRTRLVAVEHKLLGANLLYFPAIQKQVGVTPSQAAQIADIRSDAEKVVAKVNRRFEDGTLGSSRRVELLRADRMARGEEILRLLTPEQRDAFSALSNPQGM